MEEYDLQDVAYEKIDRGYSSQWELMDDLFAWLDLRIYFFYEHHQWLGPKNDMRNMMGLVVSREEFEHNLVKAAQLGLAAQLDGGRVLWCALALLAGRARADRFVPALSAALAAGLVCGALALVWQGRGNLSLLLTALWLLAAPAAGNMRMERLG